MSDGESTWIREARDRAASLRNLADAASRGPWFVRAADDPCLMSATYITNCKPADDVWVEKWDHPKSVIAITLLQEPALAVPDEEEENSLFIAASRTEVPWLCGALGRAIDDRALLVEALRSLMPVLRDREVPEEVKRAMTLLADE